MALPWVRLDTAFASNPKMLELTSNGRWRAAFVYIAALAYAGQHGTDGYIPDTSLNFMHATKRDAKDLIDVGLWHSDVGGYQINGWDDFQISDEAAKDRRDRARKAALKRWRPE